MRLNLDLVRLCGGIIRVTQTNMRFSLLTVTSKHVTGIQEDYQKQSSSQEELLFRTEVEKFLPSSFPVNQQYGDTFKKFNSESLMKDRKALLGLWTQVIDSLQSANPDIKSEILTMLLQIPSGSLLSYKKPEERVLLTRLNQQIFMLLSEDSGSTSDKQLVTCALAVWKLNIFRLPVLDGENTMTRLLKRLPSRLKNLSDEELISVLPIIFVKRSMSALMATSLEREIRLREDRLNVAAMALFAITFFRTQTSLRGHHSPRIFSAAALNAVKNSAKQHDGIEFGSLAKILRNNLTTEICHPVKQLADAVVERLTADGIDSENLAHSLPKLLSLLNQGRIYHEILLKSVEENILTVIPDMRDKDLCLCMDYFASMGYKPKNRNLYQRFLDSIAERSLHKGLFPSNLVWFLSSYALLHLPPPRLLQTVLSGDFYKKLRESRSAVPLERLYFLDCVAALDYSDWEGPRLSPSVILDVKHWCNRPQSSNAFSFNLTADSTGLSQRSKILFGIKKSLQKTLQLPLSAIHIGRILPQFHSFDIVLRLQNQEFLHPAKDREISSLNRKHLTVPPDEFRIVICPLVVKQLLFNTVDVPVRVISKKFETLESLGYNVIPISHQLWKKTPNQETLLKHCFLDQNNVKYNPVVKRFQ